MQFLKQDELIELVSWGFKSETFITVSSLESEQDHIIKINNKLQVIW